MRHRKKVVRLNRTASHRKATMANMAMALFKSKHITTTEVKAKAARRYAERLITLGKKDTTHARRMAMKKLSNKECVHLLFEEIAPAYADRNGGYTRVIKLGQRHGDSASMAILELVGFEAAKKKQKDKDKETRETKPASRSKAKEKKQPEANKTAAAEEKKPAGKKPSSREIKSAEQKEKSAADKTDKNEKKVKKEKKAKKTRKEK